MECRGDVSAVSRGRELTGVTVMVPKGKHQGGFVPDSYAERKRGKMLSLGPARRLESRGEKMEGLPGELGNEQNKMGYRGPRLSVTERAALSRGTYKQGQGGKLGRPVCVGTVEATEGSCALE